MRVLCTRRRWGFARAVLGVALLACLWASAASAHIASHLSWQRPVLVDPSGQLAMIACSSASLCIAADDSGNVVTSTDPAGGATAWNVAHVDSNQGCGPDACSFQAISCPSTSFCAAVDDAGYVFTSTDPTAGAAGWSSAQINRPNDLTAISCPSVSVCVAVNYNGEAIASTNPTAGAGAWHATTIDSGFCTGPGLCHGIGNVGERQLDAISCPSVSLCVAGDWDGDVITSTDPAGGSNPWSIAYADNNSTGALTGGSIQVAITDVSCPSVSLCVGNDGTGGLITSQNPTGGASAWKLTRAAPVAGGPGGGGFWSLSCPSASLCGALYQSSWSAPTEVDLSYHPLNGAEWTPVTVDRVAELRAISCLSELLCVAVDKAGHVIVGRAKPPTRVQIQALLRTELTPPGSSALIGAVLRNKGLSLSLNPPTPGSIRIRWLFTPTAANFLRGHARPVLIARGQSDLPETERATIPLALTNAGATILRRHAHLRITAEAIFSPLDGRPFTATQSFALRR